MLDCIVTAVISACIKETLIKIGEFLCSHFNVEDWRKYTTFFGTLCFIISRKVKTQLKHTQKKICAVYGEGAVTDWMCQKWFANLHARDFSLDDDAPWLGRPVEVDSDQIKRLIENINILPHGR